MSFTVLSILALASLAASLSSARDAHRLSTSNALDAASFESWGDSARECFNDPTAPTIETLNQACWSEKMKMLPPLIADGAMDVPGSVKQSERNTAAMTYLQSHPAEIEQFGKDLVDNGGYDLSLTPSVRKYGYYNQCRRTCKWWIDNRKVSCRRRRRWSRSSRGSSGRRTSNASTFKHVERKADYYGRMSSECYGTCLWWIRNGRIGCR